MIIAALAAVAAIQFSPADLTRLIEGSTSMQSLRRYEAYPTEIQMRTSYQCDLATHANDEIAELQENLVHGRVVTFDPTLVTANRGDNWYTLTGDDRKTIEITLIWLNNKQKNAELACKS